jgi:Tfp pilus assembly protein PilN
MGERQERTKARRREFLRLIGFGGVAGAAALATGGKAPPPAAAAKPDEAGYRETAHVKKYYETAKF